MIRKGSKNNHTPAKLKSTYKGLKGKTTLQEMSLVMYKTKRDTSESCRIQCGEDKTGKSSLTE